MHLFRRKGTGMSPTGQAGVGRRRALLRDRWDGAPASDPGVRARRLAVAVVALLSVGAVSVLVVPALAAHEILIGEFKASEVDATRATVFLKKASQANGAEIVDLRLEYSALSPSGPWTLAANVEHTAEGSLWVDIHRLAPSTHYYLRVRAVYQAHLAGQEDEEEERTAEFTTSATAAPVFYEPHRTFGTGLGYELNELPNCDGTGYGVNRLGSFCAKSNPAPTSGFGGLATEVYANGAETHYHFEYSTTRSAVESGSGTPVSGVSGSLTASEEYKTVEVPVEGLAPETTYFLRGVAENEKGAGASKILEFKTHTAHPEANGLQVSPASTAVHVAGLVVPNGLETHWRFEYASEPSGPWTDGPAGTIPQAPYSEDGTLVEGTVSGLSPGASYYVRLRAENEPEPGHPAVATSDESAFRTSGQPAPSTFAVHALHGEALRLLGYLEPNNSGFNDIERVTMGGSPTGGTFTLTTGGLSVTATGTGELKAGHPLLEHVSTTSGHFSHGEPISGAGIPAGTTVTGTANGRGPGEIAVVLSQPATVTATGVSLTAGLPRIPFDASHSDLESALEALPGAEFISPGGQQVRKVIVDGPPGGPYTVEFVNALGSANRPPLEADASGLTPSGTVNVASVLAGSSFAAHYHFDYVSQTDFEEHGWANASSTPEAVFAGHEAGYVGQDLPQLAEGQTYRYRLTATNATAGNPIVHGTEQTLTVPVEPQTAPASPCPNEALRVGPSASLSDCRAYEQVTPHDKEGAMQPFRGGSNSVGVVGAAVGEDGSHLMIAEPFVHWGTGTTDGGSPYFFSRTATGTWKMTAAGSQPEASISEYRPALLSPDLTSFAFDSAWQTGQNNKSPDIGLVSGQPGGPYVTAASVPRGKIGQIGAVAGNGGEAHPDGWVGASEDFSKLIVGVEDRTLAGHPTGTAQSLDLYEESGGALRQANVSTGGAAIGTCGAHLPLGLESYRSFATSARHAVSADGSRVFFEAVPGSVCSASSHLYERVRGEQTLDLGTYTFLAANPQGSRILLERVTGPTREILMAESESSPRLLFTFNYGSEFTPSREPNSLLVSEDLTTIYLSTGQHLTGDAPPAIPGQGESETLPSYLYRFEVGAGQGLRFLGLFTGTGSRASSWVSPDGRYLYWKGSVGGLPAGEGRLNTGIMRYDSAEDVVSCVSCASPFDPEPKDSGHVAADPSDRFYADMKNNTPYETMFSADGDYAFFVTKSPLVPKDVNGEVTAEQYEAQSPSLDVYEWRRAGVTGCGAMLGCLSLISSGSEGGLVYLLGSANEGRDVFFTTEARLGPNDNDQALDVYDARIGGGEPPLAARPVECEGSACSTPPVAPLDLTPASLTFSGLGDVAPVITAAANVPPKPKAKPKPKLKKKHHKRRTRRFAKKGGRAVRRRGMGDHRRGR